MNITYVSACFDISGYGEAARNYIGALAEVGIKVNVVPVTFEQTKPDLGKLGTYVQTMVNTNPTGDISIYHMTPTNFPRVQFTHNEKYKIGYCAWETTLLPNGWSDCINQLNELWVPSNQNVEAFRDSGVKIPIFRIPHCFNNDYWIETTDSNVNVGHDEFKFLSIFQWTERKNPLGLLKAYLTEFQAEEKVSLTIKTYLSDPRIITERNKIKEFITQIKNGLHLGNYPKIYLILDLLSRAEIQKLHKSSDCFVLPHRNEGFGVPCAEAMMLEKPVITTNYGGTADFIFQPDSKHPDVEQTGYLIDYQMTPVFGMPWATYSGNQAWAEPNVMHLRSHMRDVFTDREKASKVGSAGKQWIESNLSWTSVGNMMKDRLEIINKRING